MAVHFALFWFPILCLFGMTLWLRSNAFDFLWKQRELDRCVYSKVQPQCEFLSSISRSNATLKRLILAVAALKAAKTGAGIATAGTASASLQAIESGLRTAAQNIVRYQEFQLKVNEAREAVPLVCGWPVKKLSKPVFNRPATKESALAGITPALTMETPPGELWVRSLKRLSIESFAHCRASGKTRLNGERYEIDFRPSPATPADRWPSRRSLFSPPPF